MSQSFWLLLYKLSVRHLVKDAHVHQANALHAMAQGLSGRTLAAMPDGSIVVMPTKDRTE